MGLLPRARAEAGFAREDITTVAFAHMHIDHVNGLWQQTGGRVPEPGAPVRAAAGISVFDRSQRLSRFSRICMVFGDGLSLGNDMTAVQAAGHSAGAQSIL